VTAERAAGLGELGVEVEDTAQGSTWRLRS
jgi:hypothetical protein